MDLRPELRPPRVSKRRVKALLRQIDTISTLLREGKSADASIAAFNKATGGEYEAWMFDHRVEPDLRELVTQMARPSHPRVPDITREELIEIVRRIVAVECTNSELDYYLSLVEANVPHPAVSDLIYWPPDELVDASPEQIVDEALRYRPAEG